VVAQAFINHPDAQLSTLRLWHLYLSLMIGANIMNVSIHDTLSPNY
jgi:hypothetical protein